MSEQPRVLIVGGGIAGLSTAYFLAQQGGLDVRVLEMETSLGQHSTGLNAAILRTWTPDPVLTRFAMESYRFLASPPPGFTDVPLIEPCGLILAGSFSESDCRAVYSEACDSSPEIEALSEQRFRELAPHFGALDAGSQLMHFPSEGRLDIAAIVEGFARGARQFGARIDTGIRVRELCMSGGSATGVILDDNSRIDADCVVLAAGGWATRLAKNSGSKLELSTTRRHLLVTEPAHEVDSTWPIVWFDSAGFYARPESGGLLLCAGDQTVVEPDRLESDPAVLESIAAKTVRFLPEFASSRAAHFWAGMRTLSHDGRFVIGPDEDVPGLFWVAGLGGHGMTSSAAIGQHAAEQISTQLRLASSRS